MKHSAMIFTLLLVVSCNEEVANNAEAEPITRSYTCTASPCLRINFKVDSSAPRLNNLGQTSSIPSGNAAQSPTFKKIAAHYYELLPNAATQVRGGAYLYQVEDTDAGGSTARDFSKINVIAPNNEAFSISLSQVPAATYQYLRISVSYQEFDVVFQKTSAPTVSNGTATIASFLANLSYVTSYSLGGQTINVNSNKAQGYWGFYSSNFPVINGVNPITGQAPSGATTVVNLIESTSPISREQNSCIVTGAFTSPLTITGSESADIVLDVTFSTNQSFEWKSTDSNSDWNLNSSYIAESVVDMGVRGMTISKQ